MAGPWEQYQQQEGPWTAYQQRSPSGRPTVDISPPDPRDNLMGKVDSAVRGVADTLSFGLADEFAAGMDALMNPLLGTGAAGETLSDRYAKNLEAQRGIDRADATDRSGYRIAGQVGGAITGGAGLVKNGLSLSANAMNAGAGLTKTAGASALEGGILGAAQGFGNAEGGFENRLSEGAISGGTGAVIGGAAPYVLAGIGKVTRGGITPNPSNPTRESMVDTLKREGVDVTAGQRTGSKGLRYAESELGGGAAGDVMQRQQEQFTAAALKRAGIDSNRALPEVFGAAFDRVGKQFDDLAARNTMQADKALSDDLQRVFVDYASMVPESMRAPVIESTLTDLIQAVRANGGTLPGDAYQALRSRLERGARSAASDPQLSDALRGIKNAMDDAMERGINPADAKAWRAVRNEYRNLLVLEKAATGAGSAAAEGIISPSQLRNATVAQGRRSYAKGNGDFAELARAGEAVLKPLPDSGTAGRLRGQGMMQTISSVLGSGAGGAAGGVPGALAGAAAGALLPKVVGAAIMSRPGQAYLGNQVAPQLSPQVMALLNTILNAQQSAEAGRGNIRVPFSLSP